MRTRGGREAGTRKRVAYGERAHWDRLAGSCDQTEALGSQGRVRRGEAGPLWPWMEKELPLGTVGAAAGTARGSAWLWRRTDETHVSPEETRTRGHRGTQTLTAALPVKAPTGRHPVPSDKNTHQGRQAGPEDPRA